MARGSIAKAEITEKLLEAFSGSFLNNSGKEIRIPWIENGEELQIKITLTCAKENVQIDGFPHKTTPVSLPIDDMTEPTKDEKEYVAELLNQLGR